MNQNDETKPTVVAATPTQAGETRDRWWWVERCVWTERMVSRLVGQGLFSLENAHEFTVTVLRLSTY